jgi:phosphopantetheinyl transferase (holo-ACP synthase)
MSSIGNDIIALKTIDKIRTNTSAFYSKILAVTEQELYLDHFNNLPFEYFVWLLWSIKESAYKCLQRQQPGLVFSPVNTVVTHIEPPDSDVYIFPEMLELHGFYDVACYKSEVTFHSQTLHARSVIDRDELICTIASFDPSFTDVYWGVKHIDTTDPESQSAAVRTFLMDKLQIIIPEKEFTTAKSEHGWPYLIANGQAADIPVSLSHHGEWVGYGICITA